MFEKNNKDIDIRLIILLAEDEGDIKEILIEFIEEVLPTAEIETVFNGYLALEKIRRKKYDLLITDFQLPFVNGMELIRAIKSVDEKFRPDAAVLLSNYIGSGDPPPNINFVNYIPKNDYKEALRNYLLSRQKIKYSRVKKDKRLLEEMRSNDIRVNPPISDPVRIDITIDDQIEILRVKDISLNGVGVYLRKINQISIINKEIKCIIGLPGKPPFTVVGVFRHIGSSDQFYAGIEFTSISEKAKEMIREYIYSVIRDSESEALP
ncbi:MAG: response regulator [Oligoflexia bacterium]|nr:response regulator [Oligoflexia bacterium]